LGTPGAPTKKTGVLTTPRNFLLAAIRLFGTPLICARSQKVSVADAEWAEITSIQMKRGFFISAVLDCNNPTSMRDSAETVASRSSSLPLFQSHAACE